jgi:hypothetical protein
MTPELRDQLVLFRDKAIAEGIPAEDVERWLTAAARPCATLTQQGGGPVVGQFGGPLLLPAAVPDPEQPLVGSVDLAALPAGTTDLPLPPDGHLLFFAHPDTEQDALGGVLHVPAGSPVVERDKLAWDTLGWDEHRAMMEKFPQGPMRVAATVSLPYHHEELPERILAGHPRAEDLVAVWEGIRDDLPFTSSLQLGGYADEECIEGDPVVWAVTCAVEAAQEAGWDEPLPADVGDWVLLADWQAGVRDYEGATAHWVIPRDDLAAHRFDRVFTSVRRNP